MESTNAMTPSATAQAVPTGEPVAAESDLDECWNRMGTQGNRSCVDLSRYAHCRNCPTYARAGVLLLSRALPPEYRRERTARFAVAKPCVPPANASVTLFRLGAEWLALDTALIQEVTERRPIHTVPHCRSGVVLGLANVRGELLLCVSLARLLDLESDIPHDRVRLDHRRLMVVHAVQTDAQRFAFPVDEVQGVHRFNREAVQAPPPTLALAPYSFTRGVFRWRERTVGWLSPEALLLHLNRNLS